SRVHLYPLIGADGITRKRTRLPAGRRRGDELGVAMIFDNSWPRQDDSRNPAIGLWRSLFSVSEAILLRSFERLLDPFPPDEAPPPPKGLASFLWACTRGARRYIAALALLSACVSVYEAWLFSFLGQIVDLLTAWRAGQDAAGHERSVLWGIGIVL